MLFGLGLLFCASSFRYNLPFRGLRGLCGGYDSPINNFNISVGRSVLNRESTGLSGHLRLCILRGIADKFAPNPDRVGMNFKSDL
jgi:hypothetical protein